MDLSGQIREYTGRVNTALGDSAFSDLSKAALALMEARDKGKPPGVAPRGNYRPQDSDK